jgi:hypothetical protein
MQIIAVVLAAAARVIVVSPEESASSGFARGVVGDVDAPDLGGWKGIADGAIGRARR